LKQIAGVANKKFPLFYEDPTKVGFNDN